MPNTQEKILSLLRENARLTNQELADLTNHSNSEVTSIVQDLEKQGIILKYSCVINETLLEQAPLRVILEISVRPEKKSGYDAIAEQIGSHNCVIDHYLVSGSYDFLLIVEAKTLVEISQIISDFSSMPQVTNTVTHFTLKKYKQMGVQIAQTDTNKRLSVSP